ncbi:MAG TPA: hypothetical protein VGJ32_16670 [Solirubrobacteraceae bacterium]|jgi:hypothetical protein
MRRTALCLTLALLAAAAPAQAFRLGDDALRPVRANPADRLAAQPIDPEAYDPATHCSPKPKPGVVALQHWLERHARGVFWGSYRCETWGPHSASLHAENRAIDWHLDVTNPADKAEARRLIDLMLAPDRSGNAHALARRMGVEEIIWDCSYWGAGSPDFGPYAPCYGKRGRLRKRVDPTIAHRNHIHFGISRRGAAARTSFWR